ncbi:extracellular solute-binding protein [Frigidibacter oleivorans]|uniref:extracellular solute-binding protein n=1 Tax=Frigidibacter oleivorans TaxID=2487129 RepID=UPI001F29B5FE|nr:extracellular solute-binding protein [Frigidibacter oleivorans]
MTRPAPSVLPDRRTAGAVAMTGRGGLSGHDAGPRAAAVAGLAIGTALVCAATVWLGLAAPAGAQGEPGTLPAPSEAALAAANGEPVTVSHGFSTFGALELPPDYDHLRYVNPEAPKGGQISISSFGTFDSMNPYTRKGRAGALSTIGYESMLLDVADELASYCLLCEYLEYPESQDWVIFHMRPEATFSDGTPVTAEDVVFSHFLLLDQGLPSYAEAVRALIPEVEALDEHTVKFTFAPDVPRKNLITQAGGVPVWSKAWYEETGARLDESRMEISPGSGPYMLDGYDINRRITYRRNPDYWGNDLPINRGRNNFDSIRVEYFNDATAALEAFKAGEYTFRQETSSINWATAYDFPAVRDGRVVKAELPNGNVPGANGFVLNLRRPQLQDPRVRQALALMFNFTWTNQTLQYGLFQQRESFWQNSDLAATGVPEGLELEYLQSVADLIDPAILTEEVTMPHVSGEQQLDRGNLRRAIALLAEAGYEQDASGRLTREGQPLDVEFLTEDPALDRFVIPYVDNLRRLGVEARHTRVDPAQYTVRERDFDWDVIYDGYPTGPEEGIGLGQRFGSDGLGDVFNPAGYHSEAVDQLIEKVVDATSYDEMAAAVRAIDRIMRRELFIVPTWYQSNYWVAYYDMYEYPDPLPPYALGQLDFWWWNAEKAAKLGSIGAVR